MFKELIFFADFVSPIAIAIYLTIAASAYGYYSAARAAKMAKKGTQTNTQERTNGSLHQVRSGAFPRRLVYGRDRVGGLEVFFGSSGEDNEYLHFIFYWCEGPVKGVEQLLFDGGGVDLVPIDEDNPNILVAREGSYYDGLIRFETLLGEESQPPLAVGGMFPGWNETEPHTDLMVGCCYSYLQLKFDKVKFANGVPDISAVINGFSNINDVREGEGLKYTNNAALCLNNYACLQKLGPGLDYATEIGEDELIAAANHCEEQVDSPKQGADSGDSSGGSGNYASREQEFRYTFNGVISLDQSAEEIIERFRNAMAGVTVYIGGRLRIYAGVYQVPTFTITKEMIVGPVQRRTRASKRDRLNIVRGVYANDFTRWVGTDFPAVKIQEYIDADGEELSDDIDLLDCDSPYRAQRIAAIYLKRSRFGKEINVPCSIDAWRAQPGLTVFFHFPEIGFDMMPMDVAAMSLGIDNNALTLSLNLRQTDPSIFSPEEPIIPLIPDPIELKPPLPIPPDFSDLFTIEVPANLLLYEKLRGGVAELCGFDEFIPSVPPRKYRKKVTGTAEGPDVMETCDFQTTGVDCDVPCPRNYASENEGPLAGSPYGYMWNWSIKWESSTGGVSTYRVRCSAVRVEIGPPRVETANGCRLDGTYGALGNFQKYDNETVLIDDGAVVNLVFKVDYVGYQQVMPAVCIVANGTDVTGSMDFWQVTEEYDPVTCDMASDVVRKDTRLAPLNCPIGTASDECAGCDDPIPLVAVDPPSYYDQGVEVLISNSTRRTTSGIGCYVDTNNGHYMQRSGGVGEELSEEATEDEARTRLAATLDAWEDIEWTVCTLGDVCALSNWNPRGTGFVFGYQEAKARIVPVSGLTEGVKYILRAEIWEGNLTTLAVIPYETRVFLIDGFGFDLQIDMPNHPGNSYYLKSVRIFALDPDA